MFERYLTYARARRALKMGQFEAVLGFVGQPEVRGDRRSEQLRERALQGIMQRAERRAGGGSLKAALDDVEIVLSDSPEFDGAVSLKANLGDRVQVDKERVTDAAQLRREARDLAEQGDLPNARRLCQQAADLHDNGPEHAAVLRHIEGRQQSFEADCDAARKAMKAGDLRSLKHHLARLRSNPTRDAELVVMIDKAGGLIATDLADRLSAGGNPVPVLDEVATERSAFHGLLDHQELTTEIRRLAGQVAEDLRQDLQQGRLSEADSGWRDAHAILQASPPLAELAQGMSALGDGLESRANGDPGRALARMRVAASELDASPIGLEVASLEKAEKEVTVALDRARESAARGRLLSAREELVSILEVWPMHEPARRQLDILNKQTEDREARLQQARTLASEARLAEASGLLMGLASDTEEGREARLMLKDVHRRMDLAAEGLSQVRRAVHGQATSNREGLRHCIARLHEVGKLQVDLAEVGELSDALSAEIESLDQLDLVATSLDQGDFEKVSEALADFESGRDRLLHRDRLEARFEEIVDRVLQKADTDLHGARLSAAEGWLSALRDVATEHPAMKSRFESLSNAVVDNQRRAAALLEGISEAADTGSLEQSAEQLEAARSIWSDCPRVEKLVSKLVALHSHADAADEIERLATQGDVRGAHQRLDRMPPTPGFLRTRIFDIKQGLAKAQGLETGFLMRVDEGGEYLVLRSDSISIGNVREGKADLLLLANISGRHARIKRSLSFHGGMEDRIVAEKGEVFVNGKRVDSSVLKAGDCVRLGKALEFVYQVAGKRSLTAALQLRSGFQVAGTDKILLMKDRGRDGRILIGRADDSHIRVPHDEAEVEVYSASDGQVRVRFQGQGKIAGRPFRGEHPVVAGALVSCGDTSFVLQPWNRGA